jgi:hypothetical protein
MCEKRVIDSFASVKGEMYGNGARGCSRGFYKRFEGVLFWGLWV